jgi:DnaJ like chaperone protein
MGFWGKAIGIGFGFMIGGPLGAIIGGALGHMFDAENDPAGARPDLRCPYCGKPVHARDYEGRCLSCGRPLNHAPLQEAQQRQFVFYVSLAALAAKMAKADGVVTEDEVRAFDHFVQFELKLSTEERKIVARLFNEAKNSSQKVGDIAWQFRELIDAQPEVLQSMVHLLFRIAMADNEYHPAEEQFIHQVANTFGIPQPVYEQIKALFIKSTHRAYQIIGVSPQANDDEVKAAYKKLVMEYHPDKLMSKGVPEDFIKFANDKMAEINNSYDQIRKERRL